MDIQCGMRYGKVMLWKAVVCRRKIGFNKYSTLESK
jgi:hypothetical protein